MFYNKRTKRSLSLKIWPFNSSDIAKLYWIDHPFKDRSGDWKVDVYFKKITDGEIRKCTESWGILSTLIIGRLFKGGKLLSEKEHYDIQYGKHFNNDIEEFGFNNDIFLCEEGKHTIVTSDNRTHIVYKNAFVAKCNQFEYHIPVIEVIRTLLAKNRRLIQSILQPNSLSYFFIIEKDYYDKRILRMHFTEEYPRDLLSDSHVGHLAWLRTNKYAKMSWNEVYYNFMKYCKGLYFSFPLQGKFSIRARYRRKGNIIRIEEIIYVDGMTIDYETIIVKSPHIKQYKINDKAKKKSIIQLDNDEDFIINSNNKGMRKKEEIIEIPLADYKFDKQPMIKKIPKGVMSISIRENEDTERIFIDGDNEVSTSEIGEQEIVNGLEFKEKENQIKQYNDLRLFISVLLEMDRIYDNVNTKYYIKDLPDGKSFSRLDDEITPRKYILAEVEFDNKKNRYLIEVERQGKPLSTLMICKENGDKIDDDRIFSSILEGLVNNNGTWDNKVIDRIIKNAFVSKRIRHTRTNKDRNDLAIRLHEKIIL